MKEKKNIFMAVSMLALFIVLVICLLLVGVKVAGESHTEIGLFFINRYVENISYNKILDIISDLFLFVGLGGTLFFAGLGLFQWIKRKNIFRVDKQIIAYGISFVLVLGLWFMFDKIVIINYRPLLVEGVVESSFPSTHVMLVSFTWLCLVDILFRYFKDRYIKIGYTISFVSITVTVLFRILSGMHWITDCVGGFVLGVMMYYVYKVIKQYLPFFDN